MDTATSTAISHSHSLTNLLRAEYYNCIDSFADCIASEYVILIGHVESLKRVKKTVFKMKTVTVKGLDYFFACQIHMEL